MLLFSGPLQQQNQYGVARVICHGYSTVGRCCGCWYGRRPGCLYSGDFNLTREALSKSYGSYFDRIGTVQVPHHGSKSSFDLNNFYAKGMICPVSYGVNNKFGHPDQTVINEITNAGGCPVFVTNDRLSEFKEEIRL